MLHTNLVFDVSRINYVILNLTDSHTPLVIGNFGEVHVGLLLDADNAAKSQPVAIKTIRGKSHSDHS